MICRLMISAPTTRPMISVMISGITSRNPLTPSSTASHLVNSYFANRSSAMQSMMIPATAATSVVTVSDRGMPVTSRMLELYTKTYGIKRLGMAIRKEIQPALAGLH